MTTNGSEDIFEGLELPDPSPKELIIAKLCPFCSQAHSMTFPITPTEYLKIRDGGEFPPQLTADQREFFITGICPKCWDETFKTMEDDDAEAGTEHEQGDVAEVSVLW